MFWTLFVGMVKLFLAGAALLYAGLVVMALRTKRVHDKVRFSWDDPARSGEQVLVWVGVRVVSTLMHGLKATLDMLEDTSADVGEWLLHRREM